MTSSTTPQDRAVKALVEKFGCDKDEFGPARINPRHLSACKSTGDSFLDFQAVTLGEIVDCLADAGLLSSGTQEDQGDGSLRSEPAATGQVQWAVLRDDEDYVYYDESMARTVLTALLDDGEDSYSLYEIHEVS